jgi:hypothetical protein
MLSIRQSLVTSLSFLFDCATSYDNLCSTYLARTGTWKEETTADYMRPAFNPIRPPPTYWAIEGGAPGLREHARRFLSRAGAEGGILGGGAVKEP